MRTETTLDPREALAALGIDDLLFAIHDASFPADPAEDIGRGAPTTAASARLLPFLAELGFTGLQLGPQGQTSRDNPSPYDGTTFSRAVESIPLSALAAHGVPAEKLAEAVTGQGTARADHARAHRVMHALVADAFARATTKVRRASAAFVQEHRRWLVGDALYAAISWAHGGASADHWPTELERAGPSAELVSLHHQAIVRYAFAQHLAHQAHHAFRRAAAAHRLTLHADLQAGMSVVDRWVWGAALLRGYAMGAPPSRTTQQGQPWGYPVLDPDQIPGAALDLLTLRFDKAFAEHDGVRVDHPHALVCPWVYQDPSADPGEAVRSGARLRESPDLPDHPALARYAIARPDQLDRAQPRHADGWVRDLDAAQVDAYAQVIDRLLAIAAQHGRDARAVACEVLSTMPRPLHDVLARNGLGRFRVLQKAKLDDERDVYRVHRAQPADWLMLSTHDTPSIWEVVHRFTADDRERWGAHLQATLHLDAPPRTPDALAHGMLAELFASPARHVMIYFTDLFGYQERFNEPGTVSAANWSLRLPATFDALYADRRARGEALDLGRALRMALDARRVR